jgi:diguanylate cyclase (GGDEF)-like protein/PAS domain S-box-containing protein
MPGRLNRVSAVLAAFAVGWFTLDAVAGPINPQMLGWLVPPVSAVLAAILCWRTGTAAAPGTPVRYFWRRAGIALGVFSVSMVSRVADSINPDLTMTSRLSGLSAGLHAVGLLLLLWPLFRLPVGVRSRAGRWAYRLDLATVMLSAALFIWHFCAGMLVTGPSARQSTTAVAVALMVAGLLGVFVVVKISLTGSATLDRGALRALGAALAVGAFGSALTVFLGGRSDLDTSMLVVPVACFLIGFGASREATRGGAAARSELRRRRYSLLPYAAVAATDALLLGTVLTHSPDALLVTVVAVLLMGLVIVRQLTAFRENDNLFTQLGRQETRYRVLVQNSSDVVSISAADGAVTYISDAVHRVLGHAPDTILHGDMSPLFHPDDLSTVRDELVKVSAVPGTTATYHARLRHADGSWRWLEIISANLLDEPSIEGIVSNARDVTETLLVQQRLSYEASHDVLTGLANRALFGERIEASVTAEPGPDNRFSIVLIDLDDFKTVNDTLGHAVGDALLVHVAERMRASVRPGDTVARLGGDEFAILFDGMAGDAVEVVLPRIEEALREPALIEGHLLSVRASFGVADGCSGDDAGDMLRRADIAMYEAKDRGEGGYLRFQPGMQARGAERSKLTESLRTALAENQFVLHYQPVVTLPEGRITGVEALVRWQHPERGLLGPDEFIAAAEATGLIVSLGRWVLCEATRQLAAWAAQYGEDAPASVSVNASAVQLREARFAEDVADALRVSGLPARRLTVEITESTAVGGGSTRDTLQALRGMGVRLSLDDFGTGASTLTLLATCPIDQIKLDRSFAPVPGPDAIATAVVQLASAFGVEAVAEGVETPAQAAKLQTLGYRRAQGYHFARPMTALQLCTEIERAAGPQPVVR